MGRQPKAKKTWSLGKGKVTPIQISFIVDRYLADNGYSKTRSVFRTEAASLIAQSPIQEAPKRLLSLGDMLDEYLCLKEQKVLVDHERIRLEQEKARVQSLLHGMQNVMNAYNASGSSSTSTVHPVPSKPAEMIPQLTDVPVNETPNVHPISTPNNDVESQNFASPDSKKRKVSTTMAAMPPVAKRSRARFPTQKLSIKDIVMHQQSEKPVNSKEAIVSDRIKLLPSSHAQQPMVQGSSVAKCLFNQPLTNSLLTSTPPRPNSQSDKSPSPPEISSAIRNNSTQLISPNHCTLISSKSVTISPFKQITCYTVERNHCTTYSSPVKTNLKLCKRDQVKGRLDFEGSDFPENRLVEEVSTSISEQDRDIFDIELPNLDFFEEDFSFTDMLGDLELDCEVIGHYCNSNYDGSADISSGSPNDSMDNTRGVNQVLSEFSSTLTQVLSEKETIVQGLDSSTALKSITKCITILSPAKTSRS